MVINGRIALAGRVSQVYRIQHVDVPPPIFDQTRFLQLSCDEGHTGAMNAKHLRQELLRQRQRVTSYLIPGLQQPTPQLFLQLVPCIACSDLLRKRKVHQLVSHQSGPKRITFSGEFSEHPRIDGETGPHPLNNALIYGKSTIESAPATHNTVATKHAGFNHEAIRKRHNERNHSVSGKVDAIHLFLCPKQNRTLSERLLSQMWSKQITIL